MCGIVGLFLKDRKLESELGSLMAVMLASMSDRGPDSAGFAVYGAGRDGKIKLTLRGSEGTDFSAVAAALAPLLDGQPDLMVRDTHAVIGFPAGKQAAARAIIARQFPHIAVVGAGKRMELYKEVGLPAEIARRFGLAGIAGTHGIGHTRMATESAVTTDGAHPFTTGLDQCLVHNGSLSNHNAVRRGLERKGARFATNNDSEVAAAYLTHRMSEGASLGEALNQSLSDLDGFYTFVVGTETGFAVLRDPVACKPAVIAETKRYVAFGTEYRALVDLPDVETAEIWEPEPARVYSWERAA